MTMNWSIPINSPLKELILSGNCTFIEVIKHDNLKNDFRKQDRTLISFLLSHTRELVETALGISESDFKMAQLISFSLIVSQAPEFSPYLYKDPVFIEVIHKTLFFKEELVGKMAAALSRILQFVVHFTSGCFLEGLPDKDNLISRLLELSHIPSISNFLHYLSGNRDESVVLFHIFHKSLTILFQSINNPKLTHVILSSILNVVEKMEYSPSPIHESFTLEYLEILVGIILSSNDPYSISTSLKIILFIVGNFEDQEEEDFNNYYIKFFEILNRKSPDFCRMVISSQNDFQNYHYKLVEVLSFLVVHFQFVPQDVFEVAQHLFYQMFVLPKHTFLHRAFLNLFESMHATSLSIEPFIQQCHVRERIVEVFSRKKSINASYWAFLLSIADYLTDEISEEWKNFKCGIYTCISQKSKSSYGGPLPKENIFESDDDSDDVQESGGSYQ